MRVIMDGNEELIHVEGTGGLKELIAYVEGLAKDSDRAISKVVVDGREYSTTEIDSSDVECSDDAVVEFETMPAREYAYDLLIKANSELYELKDFIEDVIKQAVPDYQDATLAVVHTMNKWEAFIRMVERASSILAVDYTKLSFANTDFVEHHSNSLSLLRQMSEALASKDIVSIKDIFKYELLPLIDDYIELAKQIGKEYIDQNSPK